MLNGPALLRVFLVVIAAAVLTGLVQHYWIFDSSPPETHATGARPTGQGVTARRTDPAPVRSPVQPAPPPPPVEATQTAEPNPMAPPDPRAANPIPNPQPAAAEPPPDRPPPAPSQPVAAQPEPGGQEVAAADPRAIDLVDLNTGSLSDLNGLKGGGAIGRAIIQHRPYTSADQLLSKRVLSRAIYQRIKDQITVR